MAKVKPRPAYGLRKPAGASGGGGMMGQLQRLQEEMARAQENLSQETVEVTVGGGAVRAVMNGQQKLLSIAMLQDMILAAVNEAIERSQGLAADRMGSLTGNLNIPGLM
jgi:DNA-binding protein YbaB